MEDEQEEPDEEDTQKNTIGGVCRLAYQMTQIGTT